MEWKGEWKPLAWIAAVFLACFWLPVGWSRFDSSVMEALHLMGEYDALIIILAEDNLAARRYYERLSAKYSDYMLHKPLMMEASFAIRLGGKVNPRLEEFRELIPDIDDL